MAVESDRYADPRDHPSDMILGAEKLRIEPLAAFLEGRRALLTGTLCLVWLLPGLVGRDPWKPTEAYIFGVVHEMVASGNWLVPTLGGEPFLRHPPFYHWTAALVGMLLSPLLPLHDAVRLVNVLYVGAAFGLVAATARLWFGTARAAIAPLALLGCVGLFQPAHQLLPENGALLACALFLYSLALRPRRPLASGLVAGTGIGIAFLCLGIVSAVALAGVLGILPAVAAPYRTRSYARTVGLAGVAALPWIVAWPAALYAASPALFGDWLQVQQVGRFWSELPGAGKGSVLYYLSVLPWFAWPVLPFAAWAVWLGRRRLRTEAPLLIPAATFALWLVLLSVAHDKREVFAVPLLPPLALLATSVAPDLRRGAVNAFFWFGIAFFLFFMAVVWFYFGAVEFGVPEQAARHMARMEPGYVPGVGFAAIAAAALLSLAWIASLFNIRRSTERPFITWAIGASVFWCVLMLLMVAWIDHAKSYRAMFLSLARALPDSTACISSLSLGESQRGLLRYYNGIVTLRVENGHRADACEYLLVEGSTSEGTMTAPWQLVWEGHRQGDNRERFRLYRNDPVPPDTTTERSRKR